MCLCLVLQCLTAESHSILEECQVEHGSPPWTRPRKVLGVLAFVKIGTGWHEEWVRLVSLLLQKVVVDLNGFAVGISDKVEVDNGPLERWGKSQKSPVDALLMVATTKSYLYFEFERFEATEVNMVFNSIWVDYKK